jgi:hypothetical protein
LSAATHAAEPQTAAAVLLVQPARFGVNAETAASNSFQSAAPPTGDIAAAARREHAALAVTLATSGVRVHVVDGLADDSLPDELFPNNWLSLHADGTVVLYPMLAPNRRRERRADILETLRERYRIARIVDLTDLERRGEYLEGTGSLVLDRPNRIAYACRSARTHGHALARFASELGYEVIAFDARDRAGRPIYHTNVMLTIGTRFAAICSAALIDAAERRRVHAAIAASGRTLIDLDFAQLHGFAGNLLELRATGGPVIALSTAAHATLAPAQREALGGFGALVTADVATIETYGGGSVRCMLTEVALPEKH